MPSTTSTIHPPERERQHQQQNQQQQQQQHQELSAHAKSVLPSESDRLIMLQTISAVAAAVVVAASTSDEDYGGDGGGGVGSGDGGGDRSQTESSSQRRSGASPPSDEVSSPPTLPSSSTTSSSYASSKDRIHLAERRHSSRLTSLLLTDLPRHASSHLLLRHDEVVSKLEGNAWPQRRPDDPFGCVALLLANHVVLHCGGGGGGGVGEADGGSGGDGSGVGSYDARFRNVFKIASSFVLAGGSGSASSSSSYSSSKTSSAGKLSEELTGEERATRRDLASQSSLRRLEGIPEDGAAVVDEGELDVDTLVDFSKSAVTLTDFLEESYDQLSAENDDEEEEEVVEEGDVASCHIQDSDSSRRRCIIHESARKFDAAEKAIAARLCDVLLQAAQKRKAKGKNQQQQQPSSSASTSASTSASSSSSYYTRENVIRGLKIGSAGVVAGTLFAVTGGLAAPGIAAGVAALGISTTTAAVVALTNTVALAALFGVGGGGLAAYKMKKRTDGLAEFRVRRERRSSSTTTGIVGASTGAAAGAVFTRGADADGANDAELRTTVCVSGWLSDKFDFQRPWGVVPTDPPLTDKLELLRRFYSVYGQEKVSQCENILSRYKGKEDKLWKELKKKYGRDPDHLLPLENCEGADVGALTAEEEEQLSDILRTIVAPVADVTASSSSQQQSGKGGLGAKGEDKDRGGTEQKQKWSREKGGKAGGMVAAAAVAATTSGKRGVTGGKAATPAKQPAAALAPSDDIPAKIIAWDYLSLYGGDTYTITWESDRLLKLCDYVTTLATKLAKDASKEVLKWTALATLMSAVSWPSALKKVADLIDEPWTMITVRSDEAGIELANCLLRSEEERRPVTLLGYSFGGRVVLSCLRELARRQEVWESRRVGGGGRRGANDDCGGRTDGSDEREPASVVETAILMGTPAYIDAHAWRSCRRVVAGRLINCYTPKDWILKLMYQYQTTTGIFRSTCGTSPIVGVRGVESYDISSLVTTQSTYCTAVKNILQFVGHGEPQIVMD